MSLRRTVWLSLSLLAACSGEDVLVQVRPQISICPQASSPDAECDRPIALGALPLDAPVLRRIFLRNTGDGTLSVSGARSPGGTITATATFPLRIAAGASSPLDFRITAGELGPASVELEVASDDPERPEAIAELQYEGTPKPLPLLELCHGTECGTELMVDLGLVRRTQSAAETVRVRNIGEAPLEISSVEAEGSSSVACELHVATSTRGGTLEPGASAPLVIVYAPRDAGEDRLTLAITSDDPRAAPARIEVRGASAENLPPIADARHAATGTTSLTVVVGEPVVIDGRASADPEGDPLAFSWTVEGPAGTIDDPAAGLVVFTPGATGVHVLSLQVRDSLGQASTPARVTIEATVRYGLRAQLSWTRGGDVDLHLAPAGAALFSSSDTSFENPSPDLGISGDASDDPRLSLDATGAPGAEEIVVAAPAPGSYRIYAHYFDDLGQGEAEVTARIVADDSATPVFEATRTLAARCELWVIGDVTFPGAAFTPDPGAAQPLCR